MSGGDYNSLPRPELGTHMYRRTLNGLIEEALVVSIRYPENNESWIATLFTKNGVEFTSSDVEYRTKNDWVPSTWMFDEVSKTWVVIDLKNKSDSKPVNQEEFTIPVPQPGEKYMAWRSRVFREIPALKKEDNAADLISEVWHSRENEENQAQA
jgi:hypothetical protein